MTKNVKYPSNFPHLCILPCFFKFRFQIALFGFSFELSQSEIKTGLYFIFSNFETDPNSTFKSDIFEDFSRISLELHFFLYVLPCLAQNFYFLTRSSQPKTDFYVKN